MLNAATTPEARRFEGSLVQHRCKREISLIRRGLIPATAIGVTAAKVIWFQRRMLCKHRFLDRLQRLQNAPGDEVKLVPLVIDRQRQEPHIPAAAILHGCRNY